MMTSPSFFTSIITLQAKARKTSELSAVKFQRKTVTNDVEDITQLYVYKLPDECSPIEVFNFLKSFTETVATFTVALTNFKTSMLQELRHDDQLEYLRNIRKPASMMLREFLQKLKTLNSLSKRFPDAPLNYDYCQPIPFEHPEDDYMEHEGEFEPEMY